MQVWGFPGAKRKRPKNLTSRLSRLRPINQGPVCRVLQGTGAAATVAAWSCSRHRCGHTAGRDVLEPLNNLSRHATRLHLTISHMCGRNPRLSRLSVRKQYQEGLVLTRFPIASKASLLIEGEVVAFPDEPRQRNSSSCRHHTSTLNPNEP